MLPGGFNSVPDIVDRRATLSQLLGGIEVPPNPNVTSQDRVIPGPDGEPDISVRIYRPVAATGTLPGIYYIHGGGMVLGNVEGEDASRRPRSATRSARSSSPSSTGWPPSTLTRPR